MSSKRRKIDAGTETCMALRQNVNQGQGHSTFGLPQDLVLSIFDFLGAAAFACNELELVCTDWRHIYLTQWHAMPKLVFGEWQPNINSNDETEHIRTLCKSEWNLLKRVMSNPRYGLSSLTFVRMSMEDTAGVPEPLNLVNLLEPMHLRQVQFYGCYVDTREWIRWAETMDKPVTLDFMTSLHVDDSDDGFSDTYYRRTLYYKYFGKYPNEHVNRCLTDHKIRYPAGVYQRLCDAKCPTTCPQRKYGHFYSQCDECHAVHNYDNKFVRAMRPWESNAVECKFKTCLRCWRVLCSKCDPVRSETRPLRLCGQCFVTVRADGKVLTLDVNRWDTIENVKQKIEDAEGIPPSRQHLFHGVKHLQHDEHTLADYDIEKDATIQLGVASPQSS